MSAAHQLSDKALDALAMERTERARRLLQEVPRNIKTSDLAEQLNVSGSWVNQFLKGKIHSPASFLIEKIILIYGN